MFASRYTRSGVFAWAPAGLERQGLIVADWAQQFDSSLNASGQAALDYVDAGDLATPRPRATTSLHSEYRVNSAVWCSLPHAPSQHPSGLLLAGCDNGRFVALDAQAIVDGSSLSVVSARADHRGGVTALAVSACNKWAMSGAGAGQLLLWDLSNLQQPFSPGQPSFQDQVKAVQWNREMENICASLSSHRSSLWDMRHPGAPIMELGEIGGGVDWHDLAWSPSQGTVLLTASQSDALPLLYKWDLRYPSAPVGDLRIHQRGITSLDWSTADPRLLLSASHDGQILLTDPETSQMMGRCGVSSTDRVRVARWSPGRPHLIAIQYHQQPIQLTSLQPIGQKEEADPELLVDLYTVPKWEAAAPVGCSFSMGGRQAVHLAERDENGQMQYRVEIRRVLGSQCVYERAMRLQNACDGGQLEEMCQERAAESLSALSSEVWRWLGARAGGGGRSAYLKMLQSEGGEVHLSASAPPTSRSARSQSSVGTEREEERASAGREDSEVHNTLTSSYATSSTTTTTNHTTSSMGGGRSGQHRVTSPSAHSTVSSEEEGDVDMAEWPAVEWERVDAAGWSALDSFIRRDYITVVDALLSRGDWAGAFVFCSHDEKWTRWLVDKYMTEKDMSASTRLVLTASLDGAHHLSGGEGGGGAGGGGGEWPRIEWKRQLALLMLSQHGASALSARLRHLADRWKREDPSDLLPCIPAILLGDVEQLLASNDSLPIEERVEQAVILRASCKADKKHKQQGTGPLLESLLLSWCGRLRDEGCMDAAWRLLADIEPHAESLSTLRHCLWEACGGRERTQRPAPPCPHEAERRTLAASMQGQRRPSVPPSSSFMNGGSQPYPQPSQFHSYPAMGGGGGMMAPPPLAPPPSSYGQPMMAPPPVAPPPMGGGGYGYGGQMAPPPPVMAPPPMAPPMMQPQQQQPSPTSMNGYSGGGYQGYQPSASMSQPLPPQQQPLRPGSVASSAASLQHLPPQTPTLGGSGWNDPPPMMGQKKQQPRPVSVMQVSWNPTVATVRPSAEGGGGMEVYGGVGMGMQVMQGQPSPPSAPSAPPPPPPAPVDLSPEDRQLMDTFTQLADAVLASGRVPATVRKAEDIKTKLAAELAPRLAANKLSPTTRQLLWQISQCGSSGDWRAASAGCAHMVRAGGDFVEVSPFVPALKSLYSLAQQTFPR